ncbi:MAG: hypothetical protein ACRCZQ_11200, partial [Bacteroidales bacterium]
MALIAQGQFIIKKLSDSYLLEVSDKIVNKTNAGVLTPSGVSARAYKIVGNSRVELSNATIKLFSGSGETAVPYTSGQVYAIKSTDILLKWQLIISSVVVVQESTAIIENGKDGDKGDQGLPGALVRSRGEWKPYTQYVNNSQYRDTVIYNKNKYIVKSTHTSGSTFIGSQWESFNEFINVATQVLLADQAWIDILNTQGIAVGSDAANRWELTAGKIRHTRTGLELTADGKIVAPPGGITFSSGKTVEEAIQDKVDAIEVGGRNLFLNTNRRFEGQTWDIPTNVSFSDHLGGSFSIGCDVTVNNVTVAGRIGVELFIVHTDNEMYGISAWKILDVGDSFKGRLTGSGILKNKPIKEIRYKGCFVQLTATIAYIEKPKLETGNKPTDWSPAPEDIDDQIDNIQVGGRNLIRNTKSNPIDGYWRHNGWADSSLRPYYDAAERSLVFRAREGWVHFGADFPYNTKECVISFEYKIKTLTGDSAFNCALTRAPEYGTNVIEFMPTREWQKASLVTLWQSNYIGFTLYNPDHNTNIYEVYIRNLKVELGNKPTDWSPAPEDIDYLTEAIQGDTVLNGGLVMSNVMAVRNGKDNTEASIVAGMSGLKDDGVFFFADLKNAYRKAVNYFKGLSSERPLFAVSK